MQSIVAANSSRRRHISAKQRAWLAHYVDSGCRNPIESASAVGFTRPLIGEKLVSHLADLIDSERLRRSMGQQMEIDEALSLVAGLARGTQDEKVKHAALRTVLEVHGVLSGQPRVDRHESLRKIHQLVDAIQAKVGKGKVTIRAKMVEAEVEEQKSGNDREYETVHQSDQTG